MTGEHAREDSAEEGQAARRAYRPPMADLDAPSFGIPGAGGAAVPSYDAPLPEPPGPSGVDLSQLPPPAVMSSEPAVPVPDPRWTVASAGGSLPDAAVHDLSDLPPGQPVVLPAPSGPATASSIPGFTPAPGGLPGYTPAPAAPTITLPSYQELPPLDVSVDAAKPVFVDDEYTQAARARADADLLTALEAVVTEGASDLHISIGAPPLLRIDGALRPMAGQEVWDRERVAAALYSLLSDEQQKQFDDVLELDFAFTLSESSRFRVNFYLQRGAIGGAFRLIPTEIKPLSQLGVPEVVGEFSKLPRGLVLVTGPTGSGKSTTLAALVDLVNETRADHIVTVEDPIEFMHQNKKSLVNQREVGNDTLSFANALKHVLRQDPDVILIGELRDLETISVALTAAETGHLVFATLHTQDAGSTIDRVIDVFPPHQQGQVRTQLAATLQGVVCQTLVKRASGSGRAVATEVMLTTPAIANLIREGKTYQVRSAMQAGRGQGMHTMDQHLAELVNSGQIAYPAALEKVHDHEDFKRLVHRTGDTDPTNSFNVQMTGAV
jgi:twitching motility protein PilT